MNLFDKALADWPASGVHRYLPRVARLAAFSGTPRMEALAAAGARCRTVCAARRRTLTPGEEREFLRFFDETASTPPHEWQALSPRVPAAPKNPKPVRPLIATALRDGRATGLKTPADWQRRSNADWLTAVEPRWSTYPETHRFIGWAFRPGELVALSNQDTKTPIVRTREEWLNRDDWRDFSHVVPQPLTARQGLTAGAEPHRSSRTLQTTRHQRWLVVEFDGASLRAQCALIASLEAAALDSSGRSRLALICSSGGKSLHSWWTSEGWPEPHFGNFRRLALRVGADPATFVTCQWVRLPGGWRADRGRRQEIHFWNPTANLQQITGRPGVAWTAEAPELATFKTNPNDR